MLPIILIEKPSPMPLLMVQLSEFKFVIYTSKTNEILIRQLNMSISTGKISDGCIRDLEFNSYLYQKLIDVLI